MASRIAFIGFGEAGAAFAGAMPADGSRPRAYDLKTGIAECRAAKLEDYRRADVEAAGTAREAVAGAAMVLSLVTADAALDAAREGAAAIDPGTLWIDMNSVAPDTKREAARAIREAGGRYVDAAVMAPVHPRRLAVPLLLSGADASAAASQLTNPYFPMPGIRKTDAWRARSLRAAGSGPSPGAPVRPQGLSPETVSA